MFQLQGFHWKILALWVDGCLYRGWWLTRVAHIWRYLACEEQPGELAHSLGGPIQLLYLSHVSYKLQKLLVFCFSKICFKIAELLKITHEKRKHF